jgi:hypothetical protein
VDGFVEGDFGWGAWLDEDGAVCVGESAVTGGDMLGTFLWSLSDWRF